MATGSSSSVVRQIHRLLRGRGRRHDRRAAPGPVCTRRDDGSEQPSKS